MKDKDKYQFGWSDYRGTYGDPNVEWEPIKYSRKYEWGLVLCYVGLAIGMSMTIAPMPWVRLIFWMLK